MNVFSLTDGGTSTNMSFIFLFKSKISDSADQAHE